MFVGALWRLGGLSCSIATFRPVASLSIWQAEQHFSRELAAGTHRRGWRSALAAVGNRSALAAPPCGPAKKGATSQRRHRPKRPVETLWFEEGSATLASLKDYVWDCERQPPHMPRGLGQPPWRWVMSTREAPIAASLAPYFDFEDWAVLEDDSEKNEKPPTRVWAPPATRRTTRQPTQQATQQPTQLLTQQPTPKTSSADRGASLPPASFKESEEGANPARYSGEAEDCSAFLLQVQRLLETRVSHRDSEDHAPDYVAPGTCSLCI